MRIAAAPISWGVCEVPGWGHQMPAERVLAEMAEVGVTATELGPDGFLPPGPADRASLLGRYGLRAVGGFVPVVLHDPGHDPLPGLRAALASFDEGVVVVLAAATGVDGYDGRPALDTGGWRALLGNLERIRRATTRTVTLHPHVGTMVETRDEVRRVLDGCDVALCLDTGHLLVGGTDPAELVRAHAGRVAHAHLKDVDAELAARVRDGDLTYTQAVRAGIYRPLGKGDVDVAGIVGGLTRSGYQGWYVMEQDVVLDAEPPSGEGPVEDVRSSVAFLTGLGSAA
ncbi:sugar phosphate isomerase/epimerase family protein [Microtetraspora niveoalba]|uniref:sugar phosphate isomerase/epimerase family protein n=1 Tax=Microtetraspora niveoalba TaxID=46175 RepID=UPI00082B547A|nr:sugar phosphate isomerase/epimerase [Microtetraspora niveoalba]